LNCEGWTENWAVVDIARMIKSSGHPYGRDSELSVLHRALDLGFNRKLGTIENNSGGGWHGIAPKGVKVIRKSAEKRPSRRASLVLMDGKRKKRAGSPGRAPWKIAPSGG